MQLVLNIEKKYSYYPRRAVIAACDSTAVLLRLIHPDLLLCPLCLLACLSMLKEEWSRFLFGFQRQNGSKEQEDG
jgi:hypothetical protein